MKKGLAVLAGVAILGGMVATLNFGESVPVSDLRAARLSECPPEEEAQEKCPAGVVQTEKYCLCLTNVKEGDIANEESVIPAAKRVRMEVCELVDEQSQQKHLAVRYAPDDGASIKPNCILVLDNIKLPRLSFHNVNTGIESRLEALCKFPIGPDSWKECPVCLHPSFGKRCEDLYPAE
jgi:hypothetical protein